MINRDLYDGERMWQCKADILRLEILYKLGGVYIDADMVQTQKFSLSVFDNHTELLTEFLFYILSTIMLTYDRFLFARTLTKS